LLHISFWIATFVLAVIKVVFFRLLRFAAQIFLRYFFKFHIFTKEEILNFFGLLHRKRFKMTDAERLIILKA
jgi:TRAP-type C4-dicarboxylate transport system permease small subunit